MVIKVYDLNPWIETELKKKVFISSALKLTSQNKNAEVSSHCKQPSTADAAAKVSPRPHPDAKGEATTSQGKGKKKEATTQTTPNDASCQNLQTKDVMTSLLAKGKQGIAEHELATSVVEKDLSKLLSELWQSLSAHRGPDGYIRVRMSSFQMCPEYTRKNSCVCNGALFHVCKAFITGQRTCCPGKNKGKCSLSHNIGDSYNGALFDRRRCSHFSPDQRKQILKISALCICSRYKQHGQCSESRCLDLHVCEKWAAGQTHSTKCNKIHSFSSDHNARVLNIHGLNWNLETAVKRKIIM
jgi:hypothetical protein